MYIVCYIWVILVREYGVLVLVISVGLGYIKEEMIFVYFKELDLVFFYWINKMVNNFLERK